MCCNGRGEQRRSRVLALVSGWVGIGRRGRLYGQRSTAGPANKTGIGGLRSVPEWSGAAGLELCPEVLESVQEGGADGERDSGRVERAREEGRREAAGVCGEAREAKDEAACGECREDGCSSNNGVARGRCALVSSLQRETAWMDDGGMDVGRRNRSEATLRLLSLRLSASSCLLFSSQLSRSDTRHWLGQRNSRLGSGDGTQQVKIMVTYVHTTCTSAHIWFAGGLCDGDEQVAAIPRFHHVVSKGYVARRASSHAL